MNKGIDWGYVFLVVANLVLFICAILGIYNFGKFLIGLL
jgi:hypothetical protein